MNQFILLAFLGVVGFFLFTEHRAHLLGILPYLLLLACPLMHFFHGRGGHGDHDDHKGHGGGGCCGSHEEKKEGQS